MANGFCPSLLQHIAEVSKDANPMYKVQPNGFTSMLLRASTRGVIKNDSYNGHKKTVTIKYRQRATVAMTETSFNCEHTTVPSYSEATVSIGSFRQSGFHIPDETIAAYCEDASKTVSAGKPATSLMTAEVLDNVFTHANALLHGVNQDLLGLVSWGKNNVTNSAAAQSVNLPLDVTQQPLNNGITKMLSDYKKNGLTLRPQFVGQGLMLNFVMQQFAKGMDMGGIDTRILAGAFDFWNDDDYDAKIGTNQVGVFEPNSIQLVEYLKNQGFKGGEKPGSSVFGVLPLPMLVNNEVEPVWFDFQLRYNECEKTFTDAYTGGSITVDKGYQMILSKTYGLFQLPADAYRHEDHMRSVNGALRYTITNS